MESSMTIPFPSLGIGKQSACCVMGSVSGFSIVDLGGKTEDLLFCSCCSSWTGMTMI